MVDALIPYVLLMVAFVTWVRSQMEQCRSRRECAKLRAELTQVKAALEQADANRVRFRRMAVDFGLRFGRRTNDQQGVDVLLRVSSESEVTEFLSRATQGVLGNDYLHVVHGGVEPDD